MMATSRDRYQFENQSSIPPAVSNVVVTLLKNWDIITDTTHAYLAAFAPDATLELSPHKATGHEQIRGMREATTHPVNGPITHVQHTFGRLYVLAGDGLEKPTSINCTGSVEYTVGGKVYPEGFSTTFDLVKDGQGGYKIKYARIFIDNAALTDAMMALAPASAA